MRREEEIEGKEDKDGGKERGGRKTNERKGGRGGE